MFLSQNAVILKNYRLLIWLLLFILFSCRQIDPTGTDDTGDTPLTPSDFKVYRSFDGMVGIEWSYNNVKARYKIYRSVNNQSSFQVIAITSENYYVNRGLEYDSTYYYRITAVNSNNNESSPTAIVSAKPENIYPPSNPTFVTVNARNIVSKISMNLSWTQPNDYDIDYYEIYRDTLDSKNYYQRTFVGTTKGTSYTDSSRIKVLVNYFYRIIAVDHGGLKSDASVPVSDFAFDLAIPKSPAQDSMLNKVTGFKFTSVSKPASYKLIIQTGEFSEVVKELNYQSGKIKEDITVDASNLYFEPNKVYYWRVLTFSNDLFKPNSYSKQFRFTITSN